MPVTWELPKQVIEAVDRAETALRDFVQKERESVEKMSEAWVKSDEGGEVLEWLDTLDEAVAALLEVRQVPG
ncbi:hypothetical protein [Methylobacterium sp. J-067]|uniref:hypothetical protein n=1 Tax=Methylobacterium sp. J-067 TaxID=2836648 RepID=UPI001FBBD645|nr:hypothetical protein [Methylobacterium sp. J-067]MCJ2023253.1 hypothetical protein [Methylobacterium sp. J-067]